MYDEDTAVEGSADATILSKIVFNLLADSRLQNPFTLEQLIDVMLQKSLTPHRGRMWEVYTQIYRAKYANDKKVLAYLEKLGAVFDAVERP